MGVVLILRVDEFVWVVEGVERRREMINIVCERVGNWFLCWLGDCLWEGADGFA